MKITHAMYKKRLPPTLQNNFFSFKGNKHVHTVSCSLSLTIIPAKKKGALGLWVYAGYDLGRGNGIGSPLPLLWMVLFERSPHETVFYGISWKWCTCLLFV